MTDKDKRPTYEPPMARDLSAYSASGVGPAPKGMCLSGTTPYSSCQVGDIFQSGGTCNPGNSPDEPKCTGGSMALVSCYAGSQA